MFKIAILGCENSHANIFLNFLKEGKHPDVTVVGVYSDDEAACQKLNEQFGVYVMKSYDELVGKVDGIVVTARHGDNHYKYAKPYVPTGIPMFIDKPITCDEAEAVEFMREAKKYGVRLCGGSCCKYIPLVEEYAKAVKNGDVGAVRGGNLCAPLDMVNQYGNFFFYSQHLVEIVGEIYGRYPKSVKTSANGKQITVIFKYESYDVVGLFTDGNYKYYAMRASEEEVKGANFYVVGSSPCFYDEFDEFYETLSGAAQVSSFEDMIAPVFVLNAIARSLKTGNEEPVKEFKI